MRLYIAITLGLLALSACDSPSVSMMGGSVQQVSIDGSRFRVFIAPDGRAVEAHRVSMEYLPSLVRTLDRAYRAIEQVTGCNVVAGTLHGDQAIIKAKVDCLLPPKRATG